MNWTIYLIAYLILGVIFDQSYKVATRNLKNAGALTILLEFIGTVTVLFAIPFFEMKFPTDPKVYIFLTLAIVFYAINDRLNTTVRSGMEASTFSIIKQLSSVFMIFAGILFFKEEFILNKFIGAILIILSNVLIFYKKERTKPNKYVLLGILANLFYAIALFLDVNISESFNLPIYVSISLGLPTILIALAERIKPKEIINEFKVGNKSAILLTAITWSYMILAQLRAYQLGNVSIVAPLCALTVILNVIVGYIFLKEKDNLVRKIISAFLIILGIILIKV